MDLKERNEIDVQYQWDLSSLYESDEAWEKDVENVQPLLEKVCSFQGKLKNAETVREYLDADSALERKIENLFVYTSLRSSEDTRSSKPQIMEGRMYALFSQAMAATSFAVPELLSLSEEKLEEIAEAEVTKDYAFRIKDLIRQKSHTLSAEEERILSMMRDALSTPGNVANSLMDADMLYDSVEDKDGNLHELNGSNFIFLESSTDRVLRKNAFESYYRSYKNHINTLAAAYAGEVKANTTEAKLRHYASSRAMKMEENNIDQKVYDNLIETIHKHMDLMHRYVRLRKKLLKLDEVHYYDVYAPLVADIERNYTYEEAQQLVLKAIAPLGENYVNIVKGAFRDRWLDVYPNKGKSGGAYSSGTYDSNPFILTNFTGTLDSVSTIAHEMGHSLHSWHTNHTQPYHYHDYTMFVAEVASTVNENLLIEQLLQSDVTPLERLSLLNQYLEGFKGTVYRQTMFAEFEMKAHALVEQGEALNAETLNEMYKELIRKYFSEELIMDEEVQYEWSRIPHFYSPFYVYVYATGYSAAVTLSEKILHEGEDAVKKYLEFLCMGSSAYPLDELRHAGVDFATVAPVEAALKKFDWALTEAEKIAESL